jgi:hypothetical protein
MRISRLRVSIVVGSVVALAVVVALVPTVMAQGNEPPEAASRDRTANDDMPQLPSHVRVAAERLGLKLDTSRRVATNLYLVNKRGGELCMVSTSRGMSMGCGPASDFFGSNAVQYGIAEDGPPDAPSGLTIAGVARSDVASVRVVLPSGPIDAAVSADGGFSISAGEHELERGRPTELIALGRNGRAIQSLALPQD